MPLIEAGTSWRLVALAVLASVLTGLVAALADGHLVVAMLPVAFVGGIAWALRASLGALASTVLFVALLFDNTTERPGMGLFKTPLYEPGRFLYVALDHTLKVPGVKLFGLEVLLGCLILIVLFRGPLAFEARGPLPANGLKNMCTISALTILLFEVYGIANGGNLNLSMLQFRPLLLAVALPLLFGLCFRDRRYIGVIFALLATVACIRSLFGIHGWATVVRHGVTGDGSLGGGTYVMTHSDSVLLATVLILCFSLLYERPSLTSFGFAAVVFPICMFAIIINNRRIAVVALVISAIVIYLVADGLLRRRVHLTLAICFPFLVIYVGAGWHSNGTWARPVQTIKSVSESSDSSAQTRDVENYNLTYTMRKKPILGYGFGHEYIEQVKMHDISAAFEGYRYVPHNSILGLLYMVGIFGFAAIWLTFMAAVFLAVRTYRFAAQGSSERVLALVTLGVVVTHAMQAFGDMGMHSWMSGLLFATFAGLISVAAVRTGAWPTAVRRVTTGRAPA
jgi:hypothetical protein